MHKKLISLGISLTIFANTVPANLVESFAEEVTKTEIEESVEIPVSQETLPQEDIPMDITEDESEEKEDTVLKNNEEIVTTTVENTTVDNEIATISTDVIRTATVNVSVENGQYGNIEGLDGESKIEVKSGYTNISSSSKWGTTTFTGTYNKIDDEKSMVVTPKSGYEFDQVTLIASKGLLELAGAGNDFETSVEEDGDVVTLKVSPLTGEKWTKNALGDKTNISSSFKVKFVKKSDAKTITTEVEGEGTILPDDSEDLVYEDGGYTIGNNTHTFKVTPAEGMEVKSVTLDGEELSVVDGKVVIDNTQGNITTGALKAVFGEPAAVTYDLDVTVIGNGKVVVAGHEVLENSTQTISLDKDESYQLGLTPDEEYYLGKVLVDGVEITDYKLEKINTNHTLVVNFNEKIDTYIDIKESDLTVQYDGEEKTLVYTVKDENGNTLKTDNVEFLKKNLIGQWKPFNPKDEGEYNFTVDYPGDATHKKATLSGTFTIADLRKDVVIDFENISKVYNGEVQYPTAIAKDGETGEVIEGAEVSLKYDLSLDITKTRGKDVGTYPFKATFEGNDDYKATTQEGTFEITKCNPKVTVGSAKVEYNGEAVALPVTVNPECGYITIYTGVNAKLSPKIYIDLNLGNDTVSLAIKSLLGNSSLGTVGDLVEILNNNEELLTGLGVDLTQIVDVLEVLPSGIGLAFGAPNLPGGYLGTAVVVDKNANTAIGLGTLLIVRQDKEVVFTEESLADRAYIKPGTDYKHEAYYEGTTSPAKIMYSGITAEGELYFSETKPSEIGIYTAVAYSYDDLEYQIGLDARTFTIVKYLTNLEITSENKTYDGMPYEPTSVVKDIKGNIIENAAVEYTYYKGLKKLESAPKDAGKYIVIAKYNSTDEYFVSIDTKVIEIEKADLTVTANDAEKYEGLADPEFSYTTEGLCVGDTLEVEFTRELGEEVGEYSITPVVAKNPNYNINAVDGKLTIKEMVYSVSVSSENKEYDGKAPIVKCEVVDIVGNKVENPEVTYTYYRAGEEKTINGTPVEAPVNAGKYVVVAEYKGFSASAEFEIAKADATIIVNNVSKEEGQADPEFTYSVEGLVEGDNLVVNLSREQGESVGEYLISAVSEENPNYNVTVIPGKLTITEKVVVPDPEQPEEGDKEDPTPEQPEEGDKEDPTPEQPEEGDKEDPTPEQPEEGDKEDPTPEQPEEDGDEEEDPTPEQPEEDGDEEEDQTPEQPEEDGDKDKNESVQTFDGGIGGYAGMGLLALGGLFLSRRKRD